MTDRNRNALGRTSSHLSDSGPLSSIRPRNRRVLNPASGSSGDDVYDTDNTTRSTGGLLSAFVQSNSRSASPLPSPRRTSPNRNPNHAETTGNLGQFFTESWNQSWSSVQDLTSTFFSNGESPRTRTDDSGLRKASGLKPSDNNRSWGPTPHSHSPRLEDVAAGSLADRQAALKAARTASVLQSYDGVNGGLDVSGKHKRRNSDEVAASGQPDDYLVYIHHVRPRDTYAGLILRYKCREDPFRRANGLWSRDSLQTRRWLTIPVDACDIRGRPCEMSSNGTAGVDLLAPTPAIDEGNPSSSITKTDDYFGNATGETQPNNTETGEDKPWTHVRWVKIDSIEGPVEIGRISRGVMGYFPPRRKRSIRTVSSLSTPRQSLDLSSNAAGSTGGPSPRRPSSLSSRPQLHGTPITSRSRLGSNDSNARPVWMRQPGGVGTMGRSAKAPGPDKDYLNTWTKKHIPGLNIDGPSMSIMGSETAQFGFGKDASGIAESPFEGKDVSATNRHGTGLDRAAAAVETWLRGALAKRPSTPGLAKRSNPMASQFGGDVNGDLIELADTTSDDGRTIAEPDADLLNNLSIGPSGHDMNSGGRMVRGRARASSPKGSKTD